MKISRVLSAVSVAIIGLASLPAQATSNTTAPSNWRFSPGDVFNGVNGALDGVARLLFDTSGGSYVCSGSLLAGGMYVLTAAHCADDFTSMTIDFGVVNDSGTVLRTAAAAYVHPGWNGTLDTGADIAIIKLDQAVTTIQGYALSTTNDVGKDYLMAGYGTTGTGAAVGSPNWNEWGYGHYGYNTFDVTSKVFNDAWDGSGSNAFGETYVSDYDPTSDIADPSRYNTLQRVAALTGNLWTSSAGLGANEALIAGGDSGGGDFIWTGTQWLLSGVHSWGWQFCTGRVTPNCDYRTNNSSSYGDISGSTAVFSHVAWINSVVAVPEPETYAMLLAGLGLIGFVARRRRELH